MTGLLEAPSLSSRPLRPAGMATIISMPMVALNEKANRQPGKRLLLAISAFGALAITAYFAAIALSRPLLDTDAGAVPAKADIMIVLGGDGPARADHALALWRQGVAAKVLVTGYGDCASIRDRLVAGGVPPADVTMECRSRSTWQNAEFSAPILLSHRVHSAIIVTSWFHARRALASFQVMCPAMHFSVASVPAPAFATIVSGPYGPAVAGEYVKTVWYWGGFWLRGVMGGSGHDRTFHQADEVSQWMPC
jgi:uncharacterized SAM-binding protein YcdF (DUF218 family)